MSTSSCSRSAAIPARMAAYASSCGRSCLRRVRAITASARSPNRPNLCVAGLVGVIAAVGALNAAAAHGATSAWVNFQPAGSPVPSGYVGDTGSAFSDARGFGWVMQESLSWGTHVPLDVSPNARDRSAIGDQRQDTFIHMQYPAWATDPRAVRTAAAWELAVPNGSYAVTVAVGDLSSSDSTHRVRVEDEVVIAGFVPTDKTRFAEATRTVTVSDGRVTVDAIGGTNTKLDYVEIRPAYADATPAPPTAPAPTGETASVNTPNGAALLTDAQAAARVRRSSWEPQPQNYTANHRIPSANELAAFRSSVGTGSRLPAYNDRITGNFVGTTDEIIQWAAWKWGLDANIIRAAAVNESGWNQLNAGDVVGGTAYSFGIMQIKRPNGQQYHGWEGTFPLSKVSTAFNVDFFAAVLRTGIDGYQSWMLSRWPNMNNADVWGWVGAWYSGQWYDAGAVSYITSAKRHLANRRWETL